MQFKRLYKLHRACWTMMLESVCILYLLPLFHNQIVVFHRLNFSHFEKAVHEHINMVFETYRIFIMVGHWSAIEQKRANFNCKHNWPALEIVGTITNVRKSINNARTLT